MMADDLPSQDDPKASKDGRKSIAEHHFELFWEQDHLGGPSLKGLMAIMAGILAVTTINALMSPDRQDIDVGTLLRQQACEEIFNTRPASPPRELPQPRTKNQVTTKPSFAP